MNIFIFYDNSFGFHFVSSHMPRADLRFFARVVCNTIRLVVSVQRILLLCSFHIHTAIVSGFIVTHNSVFV